MLANEDFAKQDFDIFPASPYTRSRDCPPLVTTGSLHRDYTHIIGVFRSPILRLILGLASCLWFLYL